MNSVILVGRLTKDPELRYIAESQNAVATFSIAVDRPFAKEKTADFFRIVVFGKQGENAAKYLAKGRQVAVQGRIQNGSYKTQTGETRYTTDIVADRVEFLGTAQGGGGGEPRNELPQGFYDEPVAQPSQPSGSQIPDGFQALDDDDDLPF